MFPRMFFLFNFSILKKTNVFYFDLLFDYVSVIWGLLTLFDVFPSKVFFCGFHGKIAHSTF